jgi:cyclopropane fatty-acyl-phospholipid synthase-like methyltransferase
MSLGVEWSLENCRNPQYRAEFSEVVRILEEWLEPYGGFQGKDVLDFGCGEGASALGIALNQRPKRVVGVDLNQKIGQCLPNAKEQLGLQRLPDELELFQIEPDADLTRFGSFDVAYSWSVFEHVQQSLIVDRLKAIYSVLRPGGVMFLQTTPLYYSAKGSHLTEQIPTPWAHLLMQQDLLYKELRDKCSTYEQAYFLQTAIYETLNRITAPGLLRAAKEAGFEIVREYRTHDQDTPPAELLEVFNEDVLVTDQLVFLAVRG